MPIGECCHDPGDCLVGPHAATGWCLAATGAPVLVITTLACPPGVVDGGIAVVLVDPSTGDVVPAQEIVSCNNKDWEVNQLCDYDPDTGDLIATFIQIFEWSEDTGVLLVTNVRADDPSIVYVPVGQVRSCTDDETSIDIEVTEFCYATEGPPGHGWQAWVFLNGVHVSNIYYDAAGVVIVAPTVVDCPPLATEETLLDVLVAIGNLDIDTEALVACCEAGNLILTAIDGNTDGIEALLALIQGNVDGLEACCTATNILLTAIDGHVDGIEGLITTTNTILTTIDGHVDGIEALLTTANTVIYAEDSPHATGNPGNFVLGVRNDTNAVTTSLDGDYSQISVDSAGRVKTADVKTEDTPHASADSGSFVLGVRNDANSVLTSADGDYSPLAVDSAGRLKGPGEKAEDSASASGDVGVFSLGVRNDTDAVVTSADGDYSQISVDSSGRIKTRDVKAEDAPHVSGDLGSFALGVRNDTAAVLTSADGDYSPLATDSAGRSGIADLGGSITVDGTLNATIAPQTSGGLSLYRNLDLNATGINIKASAGQLYSMVVVNRSNTESFLKFYNKASAPVVGTDTPVMTIPLDAKNGGGQASTVIETSLGLEFSLGIGIACTTGLADASVATPAVNSIVANIGYK